jgi:glutathione synthase/RimK-type ligase-like ATP-grasp enzyme
VITLVCGIVDEPPVAMLIDSLHKIGADYICIDQAKLHDQVKLRWKLTDSGITGYLKVEGRTIDIRNIHSVYHRFINPDNLHGSEITLQAINRTRSVMRAIMDLFDILPARIVNRRRPMMSNNSKPYQAMLIKKAGFAIPNTFITNDPRSLIHYAYTSGPLIYKSISSIRSIVARLDHEAATKVGALRSLPTQFQNKIEGFNVRVHVLGKKLFATKVMTFATDYRYAAKENTTAVFQNYELTDALKKRCLRLSEICQLPFCGIDLIINPSNIFCLEVNPSPGYSYYQEATGQKISNSLASYLVEN